MSEQTLDLAEIRRTSARAMEWIHSGRPATEVTGAPSVLLTAGAVPRLLAEINRLNALIDNVYRDGYATGYGHCCGKPHKNTTRETT